MPLDRLVLILVLVVVAAGVTVALALLAASLIEWPALTGVALLPLLAVAYLVLRVVSDRRKQDGRYDRVDR